MAAESREQSEKRLKKEGRWDQFHAVYREHIDKGAKETSAWNKAIHRFKPLNSSDIDDCEDADELVDAYQSLIANIVPSEGFSITAELEDIRFVYDHIDIGIRDIKPEQCPSRGSVSLLRWVRQSDENRREFFKVLLPKIMPNRSHLEDMNKFTDDDRELFLIFDKLDSLGEQPVLAGTVNSHEADNGS